MGINHVLARKAAENSVAIEINLKTLLKTNLRYRYRVISQFQTYHRIFKENLSFH